MATIPFFDPTRPPPPITIPPPIFDQSSDENIVQEFPRSRPPASSGRTIKQSAPAPSITNLRSELAQLIEEVERMKVDKEVLEKEIISQPDFKCDAQLEQLQLLQRSIESKLLRLNDPARLKLLGKKLHGRRKKRAWLKRRNNRLKQEREEAIKNRTKLHAQIDEWQREQRKLVEKEKQAQQELDYASHFLADVHRRKAACKRYLTKFEKMLDSATLDRDMQVEIDELRRIWAAKLSDCVKEEKRLRDVLARKSAANFQRRVENEWNKTLFGDAIPKKFEHPLLGADRNREVLIEIRRDWDACLVNRDDDDDRGSAIPLGWVLPNATPSSEWAKYQIMETI
nr:programmed cell death protein 7 [Aedes albopictus]